MLITRNRISYYDMGAADFEISPRGVRIHADTPEEFNNVYDKVEPVVVAVACVAAVGAAVGLLSALRKR